jgi:uncharacterized protein (DUF934 family)
LPLRRTRRISPAALASLHFIAAMVEPAYFATIEVEAAIGLLRDRTPALPLFRESGVVEDPWQKLGDDAPVPADGMILVSFTRWREARAALLARRGPVGVALANTDPVEALASDTARLDLRATGNVLQDQALFMLRCGFDAFESEQKGFGEALARREPCSAWSTNPPKTAAPRLRSCGSATKKPSSRSSRRAIRSRHPGEGGSTFPLRQLAFRRGTS